MLMRVIFGLLVIRFIGMTASVSAVAQVDLDALLRRLAEIEAEQAKNRATIEALRSEIEEALGRKTEDGRPTEENRDVVTDVPAEGAEELDAGDQASPPSTPQPARRAIFPELAHDSRFILESEDGDFSFGIDGLLVGRYELNHREDDGTGSSDTDSGFEVVGTRINFRGKVFEDFGYWVRLAADEHGSSPVVDAAMGMWYINDDTTLVAGQFPSILTRDQGIPVDKLQTTDSSPTNYAFDPFGFKGVMMGYHTPRLVYRGIIHDGYRSLNNSAFDEPSANWGIAGQLSGMAVGDKDDWDRFNNFTSRPGSDFAWQINGGFVLQEGQSHDSNTDSSSDLFLGILESSMEGDGWNLYGEGFYRHTDPSSDGISADDFGFVVQGGAWVAKHIELYSRFDMTIPDSDRPTENDEFKTFTIGSSFYPIPHTDNIKLSLEGLYMVDAEASSIVTPNTISGVRASPEGDQFLIRAQAHLRW